MLQWRQRCVRLSPSSVTNFVSSRERRRRPSQSFLLLLPQGHHQDDGCCRRAVIIEHPRRFVAAPPPTAWIDHGNALTTLNPSRRQWRGYGIGTTQSSSSMASTAAAAAPASLKSPNWTENIESTSNDKHNNNNNNNKPNCDRHSNYEPKTTAKTTPLDDIFAVPDRPMSAWERVRIFPTGVRRLWCALRTVQHVEAAVQCTNGWTRRPPRPSGQHHLFSPFAPPVPWRYMPRRQWEERRRVQADVSIVVPLVLGWMIPIFGYVPMALSILAPRQVLSRDFYNAFEIRDNVRREQEQRRTLLSTMVTVMEHNVPGVWSTFERDVLLLPQHGNGAKRADSGIDMQRIVAWWLQHNHRPPPDSSAQTIPVEEQHYHCTVAAMLPTRLPAIPSRRYLECLALLAGVHQSNPPVLARAWTRMVPRWWLRTRIRKRADAVLHDDAMLLHQTNHSNKKNALTALEVRDACVLRGLMVLDDDDKDDDNHTALRLLQQLNQHLAMVRALHSGDMKDKELTAETAGIIMLHLPVLLYYTEQSQSNTRVGGPHGIQ